MVVPQDGDLPAAGRALLDAGDWEAAREVLAAAVSEGGRAEPEAREGLGLALWFLGRVDEALRERERTFEGYVADGRCDDAARIAVWLSHQHLLGGRPSAGRGWLARAERCLEGLVGTGVGHGWVAVAKAREANSLEEQISASHTAMRIGRACGAADLEVFALSLLGRAVVSTGRRTEGMALLEEAMVAASSGRIRNVHTLAEAYCNLIEGCAAAGEWERGAEWCELVEEFARSHGTAPLFGACRTIHADVLVATGHWPEAEVALAAALDTHTRYIPEMALPARSALAELRVRQGRLLDAEVLLSSGQDEAGHGRARALLRLAEGRPVDAVVLLERAVRQVVDHPVRAAQLLAPLVDAHLESHDLEAADAAAHRLREVADQAGIALVDALADLGAARVALARDDREEAERCAMGALAGFGRLAMPFEQAEARLELARALASASPTVAADEAAAAHRVLSELGATRAMDGAAELLRELRSGGTAGRRRSGGLLTVREREVLDLVALGCSNAAIAAALRISEKTAGHHVSRILAKLGVRNRTEAAAMVRTGVV